MISDLYHTHLESHEWKPRVGSELQVEVEKIEVRKE